MKKISVIGAVWLGLASGAMAQEVAPSQPFESLKAPTPPTPLTQEPKLERPSAGVTQSIHSVEDAITVAMIQKDWPTLTALLADYRTSPNHDAVLYDYTMGAYLRSQNKHSAAIAHYEKITQDDSLLFPRFDLAVMYFENKQYRDADRLFGQLKPLMPPPMQVIIEQYQAAITKRQGWQPSFGMNFEQTDNVNNASDLREFDIGGATFIRSEDSLPQSAKGVRYDVGLARQVNVKGNHFVHTALSADGVYYWDQPDYDELSTRAELGYRYQDVDTVASLTPFVGKTWLDGDAYHRQYGVSAQLTQRLNPKWQANFSATHSQKQYEEGDLAKRYDGHANEGVALALYQPNHRWLYYVGAEARHERLRDPSESSNRQGVRLGMSYVSDTMGGRAMLRHTRREFLADNFWYGKPRHDSETQLTASIWHAKIAYKGLVPQLNYRYQDTDSNLALYDRKNQAWFITVEKIF